MTSECSYQCISRRIEVCLFASEFTQALCSSRVWNIPSHHHSHQGDAVSLWHLEECQLLRSCIYGACLLCASLRHPLLEVWHWHRSGSDQGGMIHCPALIYKWPTSMTHNHVSHHVETRYSHWYVALRVWVSHASQPKTARLFLSLIEK